MQLSAFTHKYANILKDLEFIKTGFEENNELLGTQGLAVQRIDEVNFLGHRHSSIGSYPRNKSSWSTPSVESQYQDAQRHLNELFEKGRVAHEANIPKLEINTKIDKFIKHVMMSVGITPTYSKSFYKTNRSSTKTTETVSAGWVDDLRRVCQCTDAWEFVEKEYKRITDEYTRKLQEAIDLRIKEQKAKDAELLKQKEVAEAITNLTSKGYTAGVDYKIEEAVKYWKAVNITPEEYIAQNASDIVCDDNRLYKLVSDEFIETWRWGNTMQATVQSVETGKKYTFVYRNTSGDHGDFEDCNSLNASSITEIAEPVADETVN